MTTTVVTSVGIITIITVIITVAVTSVGTTIIAIVVRRSCGGTRVG